MLRAAIALLSLLTLLGPAAAQGQRRLALVIAIAEYAELRGAGRPVGDARAIHERLSQLAFSSELVLNVDERTLDDAGFP